MDGRYLFWGVGLAALGLALLVVHVGVGRLARERPLTARAGRKVLKVSGLITACVGVALILYFIVRAEMMPNVTPV